MTERILRPTQQKRHFFIKEGVCKKLATLVLADAGVGKRNILILKRIGRPRSQPIVYAPRFNKGTVQCLQWINITAHTHRKARPILCFVLYNNSEYRDTYVARNIKAMYLETISD